MKQRSERQMSEPAFAARLAARDFETESSTPAIVKAIAEIGHQRNELLAKLREALQSGNNLLALELARELCGLSNDKESNRAN